MTRSRLPPKRVVDDVERRAATSSSAACERIATPLRQARQKGFKDPFRAPSSISCAEASSSYPRHPRRRYQPGLIRSLRPHVDFMLWQELGSTTELRLTKMGRCYKEGCISRSPGPVGFERANVGIRRSLHRSYHHWPIIRSYSESGCPFNFPYDDGRTITKAVTSCKLNSQR